MLCLSGCRAAVQTPAYSTVSRLLLSIMLFSSVIIKYAIKPELKCTLESVFSQYSAHTVKGLKMNNGYDLKRRGTLGMWNKNVKPF